MFRSELKLCTRFNEVWVVRGGGLLMIFQGLVRVISGEETGGIAI